MSLTYKQKLEECRKAVEIITTKADKYYDDWITYRNESAKLLKSMNDAQTAFNDATLLLRNTPKNKQSIGIDIWGLYGKPKCHDACYNRKYYGYVFDYTYTATEVDSLPHEQVHIRQLPYEAGVGKCGCTPEVVECFCSVIEETTWKARKEDQKTAYEDFKKKQEDYAKYRRTKKPESPSSFEYTCCLQRDYCEEGSKCLGIIQGCKQGLLKALDQQSDEEREISEKANLDTINLKIIPRFLSFYTTMDNTLGLLRKNLDDIRSNINSENEMASRIEQINNLYYNSELIYRKLKGEIYWLTQEKNEAYTYIISTPTRSKYRSAVSTAYSMVIVNFNKILNKYSEAVDLFVQTEIDYNKTLEDNEKLNEMTKISGEISSNEMSIRSELGYIRQIVKSIEDIVNSKKINDFNNVNKLFRDASNHLLIGNNIYNNKYISNIENLKNLNNKIDTNLYSTLTNTMYTTISNNKYIFNELERYKSIVDIINKVSTELNYNLDNYRNILRIKREIDIITKDLDKKYILINDLYNSINNLKINNDDDLIKLDNIKNDTLNLNNIKVELFDNIKFIETFNQNIDPQLLNNIKLLNNLKDLSNKSFNRIANNFIFFNESNKLNNDINDIVQKNDNEYQESIKIINKINDIYYEKKNNYLYGSTYNKDSQLNSDMLLNNKIQNVSVYTYIIIIGVILIIILLFLYR